MIKKETRESTETRGEEGERWKETGQVLTKGGGKRG